MLTWDEIQIKAVAFAKRWQDACDEKSEAQSFIRDLLAVFGVADAAAVGRFEERALRDEGRGFMDYFWPKQIAIEMKTRGKDLAGAYQQLKEYVLHLPATDMPDLLMVSDFAQIILYRRATGERFAFKTKELRKHIRRFANIAGYETTREIEDQLAVNVHAAEKMARLHDALKGHGYEGHDLEVYLVRLLFCLFAEDTGIFPQQAFLNYIANAKEDGGDLSERIGKLFEVLNMPEETRAKRTLLSAELRQFRYINGGLFKDLLPSAEFDGKMRGILLECCHFDWNKISPAIFGAMFQGVMDKSQRRELGAHYTSEENILKLINPLFMDALWREFDRVKTSPAALEAFHDTISRLKFLDPACGCGNFLIITYRELRLLELEILKIKASSRQRLLDVSPLLKVAVTQFYGIECEDFPCQIAQAGMWLMDHQMNLRVGDQFGGYFARLPLTESAIIVHGNALRLDWRNVVAREELSYILGNPPFIGYSNQNEEQKADILSVYLDANGKPYKAAGKIDYVAAWYYKAAQYMSEEGPLLQGGDSEAAGGLKIRAAFVSTNSITQGEQVAAVWKPLFAMFGIHIDFAYRTFKWSNEAKGKAAVHCVIVGFSGSAANPRPSGASCAKEAFLPRDTNLKSYSRELRTNATKQENHLWYDFLRRCQPRFTRQRIIGEYIVDFYCHEAALIIELDGGQHYEPSAMAYDAARTAYLNALGLQVVRFANSDVDQNFPAVCAAITAKLQEAKSPLAQGDGGGRGAECRQTHEGKSPLSKGGGGEAAGGLPVIYHSDGTKIPAKNINPYLVDAPTVFVDTRSTPICDAPEMVAGGKPTDGGFLILDEEERDALVRSEPNALKYIRRYYMGNDFINNIKRYCLWLVDCPPNELRMMPSVMARVERVRQMRMNSKKAATQAKAKNPMLFDELRTITGDFYVAVPKVSSERRDYIPIGFLAKENVAGDMLFVVDGMGLYGFGILTSSVHNAWMRVVCGRLKSDYRYSNTVVYNNFPWPDATDEQKAAIEKLAQNVLDARALFPESSLADLYDPLTMPPDLLKAHKALDNAVMKLYGFPAAMPEAEVVARLMERYQELTAR